MRSGESTGIARPVPDGDCGPDAEHLRSRFGASVLACGRIAGEATVVLAREAIADAARALRDERGFQLLRSLTAVDYLPAEPRFQVVYHLAALPMGVLEGIARPTADLPPRTIRLKVPVPADDPVVPSLVPVYPGANYLEREVWDLFGIEFAGHPDLRRLVTPPDTVGHPLRKDHALVYEQVAFSDSHDAVMARKPKAED